MLLTEYLEAFSKVIDEYSKTGLIFSSQVHVDIRAEHIGLIKGSITFIDESRLFVTEYLDVSYDIERLTYSYHYQNKEGRLVFRYDNAAHKPVLGFIHHKHSGDGVVESEVPDLDGVMLEAIHHFMGGIGGTSDE
jgi:hypothetical protein